MELNTVAFAFDGAAALMEVTVVPAELVRTMDRLGEVVGVVVPVPVPVPVPVFDISLPPHPASNTSKKVINSDMDKCARLDWMLATEPPEYYSLINSQHCEKA